MILARRYAFFYKQQERIIQRSNKGMNTRLVDWIVVQDRDPREMPSLNANHAIMFTDVRNFTRLSEGMPSEILIRFLGTLNEVLAKPLFDAEDSGGVAYTDKFMGDGMMNIFTDAETALRTAVKVRSLLDDFNANPGAYWNEAKFKLRVDVGVGIAYGPVTVGVMGHSRRIDYTPIGDTVNLASRLEGMTKEYHTPIIINEDLRAAIRNQDAFHIRFLDRIRVKGKEHPVTIYEEYSLNSPAIRDAKKHFENDLQELQERYFSGDWKNAMSLAREIIRKYEEICRNYGLGDAIADHLPIIYLKRMEAIQRNPDRFKNWDGVYSFETK
jgi:class 3 adenylate cyclase